MPATPTPGKGRSDRMKDNILKESSAGWGSNNTSNAVTPLRIAKRDTISPSSSSSTSITSGPKLPSTVAPVVARRTSNSYKHVFSNNLVSNSPFKSQLAPRQPLVPTRTPRTFVTPRKISGEKRNRPDSLIQQAEQENARRAQELGFKRRQSRGYQNLSELEYVSKSPFKKDTGPEKEQGIDPEQPIAIAFPMKNDDESTSPETTETESSLSSKERPLTPPSYPAERQYSNSPTYVERRSPGPSALQGSPARSSLVQKPRLQGPRSRSLSIGAPKSPSQTPPVRERRKTVTFDERCDVVEFDRESHEDAVFDTDDDDDGFYGGSRSNEGNDDSLDSYEGIADETMRVAQTAEAEAVFDAQVLNDSINGLVDSMLQEASSMSGPSTPEGNHSFQSIVDDEDLMSGGAEGGVPLGRTHHVDRSRSHIQEFRNVETIPSLFDELSRNTPPSPSRKADSQLEPEPRTPPSRHRRSSSIIVRPILPPDTECVEGGLPLGRPHRSERIREAHEGPQDDDVAMLPPSPSPVKSIPQLSQSRDLAAPALPKLDFGINFSPHGKRDASHFDGDVFGNDTADDMVISADDLDEVLSNTSIASFHEYPPQEGYEDEDEIDADADAEGDRSRRSGDVSFGGQSNRSLDAIVTELVWTEKENRAEGKDDDWQQEVDDSRQPHEDESDRMDEGSYEAENKSEADEVPYNLNKPTLSPTSPFSPLQMDYYESEDGHALAESTRTVLDGPTRQDDWHIPHDNESVSEIKPEAIVSPAPRTATSQEVDVTQLDGVLKLPPTPTEVDRVYARPSLEERLKRVVSPTLSAPSPLRTSVSPIPGYRGSSHSPAILSVSPKPGPSNSPALQFLSPVPGHSQAPSRSPAIVSPPRPAHHQRAYTYDFDERPLPEPAFEDEDEDEDEDEENEKGDVGMEVPHPETTNSPMSVNFDFSKAGVDIAEMDMRSALDRLVDDVSIAGGVEPSQVDQSMDPLRDQSLTSTADGDVSIGEMTADGHGLLSSLADAVRESRSLVNTEPTGPGLGLSSSMPTISSALSRRSSTEEETIDASPSEDEEQPAKGENLLVRPSFSDFSRPPPVPPKTPEKPKKSARQAREEMIREKRREAKARESGEYFVPPRRDVGGNLLEESPASRRKSEQRRPSGRRSMSTSDVTCKLGVDDQPPDARRRISELKKQRGGVLGMTIQDEGFQSSIERELKRKDENGKKKTYEIVEHEVVLASSSQDDSIAQIGQAPGTQEKIWKTVRRPSDMNDYARQIRELQAREKPGKATGRLFVKVVQIRSLQLPLPPQSTAFTCTLNNGTHFVTTPECRLTRDAHIGQEFELIESAMLEFTLTLKVRRDPHIVQQFKAIAAPPPPPPTAVSTPSSHRGMFSFFGTPKKQKPSKHDRLLAPSPMIHQPVENLARYMNPDGTLARAFVAFKEIAPFCNGCLFESVFQLFGQRLEAPGEGGGAGGTLVPRQVGEIVLQVFRLPPIPGIPMNQLPQNAEECHWGLLNASWHKKTYQEGTLTQLGGDCSTWRRRRLRIVGGSLIAFNDVTKRSISTIDLKKAIAVEDDRDPAVIAKRKDVDDFDAMYGVERSFRIIFPDNQEVSFFADTDTEKAEWLHILRQLIGRIPSNALWAEMLWQKLSDTAKATISTKAEDHPATPRRR